MRVKVHRQRDGVSASSLYKQIVRFVILCTICDGSHIVHAWIKRDVEARLKRSAKTRPVIVLTGARQTGKTSPFRHLFPGYAFVSLDLPTEAEQAEKEPQRFLQRNPPPVIIDEVQYAPGLFRHLKVAVDAQRKRNGQFLLTGAQKFTLMRNASESLAGRADIVELETLSFAEIREALPKAELETVIVRGGFPELYANLDIDSVAFYNSYLANIPRTRCARPGQCRQSTGFREISACLCSAIREPFEQGGSGARRRHRTFHSESVAVYAGSFGAGGVA